MSRCNIPIPGLPTLMIPIPLVTLPIPVIPVIPNIALLIDISCPLD